MGNQAIVWSSVVIFLFVLFVLRGAVKMRMQAHHNKIFEFDDEYNVYDWEE